MMYSISAPESVADARLTVLARDIKAFDIAVVTHADANPIETEDSEEELSELLTNCFAQEAEMARTPADSMVGVLAKAETCREDEPNQNIVVSLIEDIIRLIPPQAAAPLPLAA